MYFSWHDVYAVNSWKGTQMPPPKKQKQKKNKKTKPHWVIMFFPLVKHLYTNVSGILEDENASIHLAQMLGE